MIGDTRIDSIEQNRIVVVSLGARETLSIGLTARDVPATAVASQTAPAAPVKVGVGEAIRVVSDSQRPGEDRVPEHVLTIEFSPEGWCDPAVVTLTSADGQVVKAAIDEWFGAMVLIGDRPAG